MPAYYNEHDPGAAAWLRELIKQGHIANGVVDERSIEDVLPGDLRGFTQCHFFAGIGGWSLALRMAGWSDDRPVWTGSCPCQPFSAAGKGTGFSDERHLWPAFHHLIQECRPAMVFGEQVASRDGLEWFDLVHADMEGAGYAVGAADLCAAGFGAPHIRQRLYWVANASSQGPQEQRRGWIEPARSAKDGVAGGLANADNDGRSALPERQFHDPQHHAKPRGGVGPGPSPLHGHWRDADWLRCRDGKWRPVEPGTFPLAHGVSERVGLLRGCSNAIVPQVAAAFILASHG